MNKLEYERLCNLIVDAAYHVHKELGPGLLESVYEKCMLFELKTRNLTANSQVKFPLSYKGQELAKDFIIDILVENSIIIELKAVESILPIHEVQLLTYMKLTNMKLGFLINFNVPIIKQGIKRKINGFL